MTKSFVENTYLKVSITFSLLLLLLLLLSLRFFPFSLYDYKSYKEIIEFLDEEDEARERFKVEKAYIKFSTFFLHFLLLSSSFSSTFCFFFLSSQFGHLKWSQMVKKVILYDIRHALSGWPPYEGHGGNFGKSNSNSILSFG